MTEYCIVTWSGIGKSLHIKTGKTEERITRQAYLEDVLKLLNTLSLERGWRLKISTGEKGVFKFIMFKPKKKKSFKHLMLYWHGDSSRVEMFPRVHELSYDRIPDLCGAHMENMLEITELLTNLKWKLRTVSSTKGIYIWTYCQKIK